MGTHVPFMPSPPKPPKPPALPPAPLPAPTPAAPEVQAAESDTRRQARARAGRSILTSSQGLTAQADTAKKTLLGV